MTNIVELILGGVVYLFLAGSLLMYYEEYFGPNSDRLTESKFFSVHLLVVGELGIVWYIIIGIGYKVFRAGIMIAPLDTIAEMIGVLVVPIVPTYFIGRYLASRKVARFHSAWISGTFILLAIMTVGKYNGQNHWW